MNVQIQTVHLDADSKLLEHVNKNVAKLSTFHDQIVNGDIYLKLVILAHNRNDKIAEIKVYVPKHSYFVKHSSKTFEESFDRALDSMANQLKRQKQKLVA